MYRGELESARAANSVCSLPRLRGRVGERVIENALSYCVPSPCPSSRSRIYPTSANSYVAELGQPRVRPHGGEGTLGREPSAIQWGSDGAPLNQPEVGPDEC